MQNNGSTSWDVSDLSANKSVTFKAPVFEMEFGRLCSIGSPPRQMPFRMIGILYFFPHQLVKHDHLWAAKFLFIQDVNVWQSDSYLDKNSILLH